MVALNPEGNAQSVLTLQPGPGAGTEAVISYPYATSTSANTLDLVGAAWTGNGLTGGWRTFFKYDYSALPAGAIIDSAVFSLTANPASSFGQTGHPTRGSANAGALYRITGTWNPSTVTWNTQPAYAIANAAMLPQSTGDTQNYPRVIVTNLVKDQILYGNQGFMLKLDQETTVYNSLIFHSSRAAAAESRPKLQVYYHMPTSVASIAGEGQLVSISPNPASDFVTLRIQRVHLGQTTARITDIAGRMVLFQKFDGSETTLNVAALPRGVYTLSVLAGTSVISTGGLSLR